MKRLALGVVSLGCMVACGGKGPYIDGFKPPALQAGYTRLVTPVIEGIQPGDNKMWCQWLQGPATQDQDVVTVTGAQSKWGHHVILYATTMTAPVGTSRECTSADMESVRYLGGIGGEGTALTLPDGVALRLPAGQALMVNIHFINASQAPVEGQAVVDVQFADPSPTRQVAGFFANLSTAFNIPAHQAGTADATCVAKRDMNFFVFGDHMHQLGTKMTSEIIRGEQGPAVQLAQETIWLPEFEFNPKISQWPLASPMTVKMGDTIHSHCEWNNTLDTPALFPVEMCVGFGFYLPGGNPDEICSDGNW